MTEPRSQPEAPLAFPVYWMRSGPLAIWTTPGVLRIADDRIRLRIVGRMVFDAPTDQVRGLKFPGYNFGTVFKLTIDGKRFRIALDVPVNVDRLAGGGVPRSLTDEEGIPPQGFWPPGVVTARQRGAEVKRRLTGG